VDSGQTARVGVPGCGNDEGAGLGDRFAQQINQGGTNAVVADARRGEQKFHDASPCRWNGSRKAPPVLLFVTVAQPLRKVPALFLPASSDRSQVDACQVHVLIT